MYRVSACWIALLLPVLGQADSDWAPRQVDGEGAEVLPFEVRPAPELDSGKDHSRVLVGQLRTIRLEGGGDGLPGYATFVTPAIGTVEVGGLAVPKREELVSACGAFLGAPLTEHRLDRLTDTILAHYQENGRPVVDILVPEQDFAEGALRITVLEGRVGKLVLQHSEYFNTELLSRSVWVRPGDEITTTALQEQLDWLSRNPFRAAGLYASPGEEPAVGDFVITLDGVRPWRVYLGYENTGTEAAGEDRYFLGGNHGNLFGLDHQLGYQFTMSGSPDEFQAHSIAYEIPLHQQHYFLRFNGTWQEVEATSEVAGLPLEVEGETLELYFAVGRPLPRVGGLTHELALGVEVKNADSFLSFGGVSLFGDEVDIVQARLDYRASGEWGKNRMALWAAVVASPGGLTGQNNDEDFEAIRPGAQADYLYALARADWFRRLGAEWSLRVTAEAQISSQELLPIEQFSLGGYETVRGFDERIYLADSGIAVSTELRSPAFELPEEVPGKVTVQLLGFLDHATGWRDFDDDESFTGAGFGGRARLGDTGTLRADLGWPLSEGGSPRAHLGFQLSF